MSKTSTSTLTIQGTAVEPMGQRKSVTKRETSTVTSEKVTSRAKGPFPATKDDRRETVQRIRAGLILHTTFGPEILERCADLLREHDWSEERIADLGLHGACPTARFEDRTTEVLFHEYRRTGDLELRNQLLECFYPMVRHVSASLLRRFPRCVDIEELVSAGTHGLYRALEAYDPERGGTFKTYCTTRIKGAILDELRSQDWVPRAVRMRAQRFERAREQLSGEFGREPTSYELANHLGLTIEEFQEENIDAVTRTMKNFTDGEVDSEDSETSEPFRSLTRVDEDMLPSRRLEREETFTKLLEGLSEKERLILSLYYHEGLKMREIGARLTITESRVCQIHSNVMERLRQKLQHRRDEL
ncbi:MAG: FliA/WhiG family RNA polymerase sigma factor [Planctomycetes bacterium]|nr:FliA/WhiG family RNA polymerase sigma factor [Planctomycetota bacterium]